MRECVVSELILTEGRNKPKGSGRRTINKSGDREERTLGLKGAIEGFSKIAGQF